jgi:hypothetical protein
MFALQRILVISSYVTCLKVTNYSFFQQNILMFPVILRINIDYFFDQHLLAMEQHCFL